MRVRAQSTLEQSRRAAQHRPVIKIEGIAMNQFTPVLHSVSYASAWPGHSFLDVDAFLNKAVELGYRSIALVAKRPHVSPLDYDEAARRKLRTRIEELGL